MINPLQQKSFKFFSCKGLTKPQIKDLAYRMAVREGLVLEPDFFVWLDKRGGLLDQSVVQETIHGELALYPEEATRSWYTELPVKDKRTEKNSNVIMFDKSQILYI